MGVKVQAYRAAHRERVQLRKLFLLSDDEVCELLERFAALCGAQGAPCWEGGLGRVDGRVDVVDGGF